MRLRGARTDHHHPPRSLQTAVSSLLGPPVARTLAARLSGKTAPVGPLLIPLHAKALGPPPAGFRSRSSGCRSPWPARSRRRSIATRHRPAFALNEPTQVTGRQIERRLGRSR